MSGSRRTRCAMMIVSSQCRSAMQSASVNARRSARARPMPRLRASPGNRRVGHAMSRTQGNRRATISAVPSEELSTTITSPSNAAVCASSAPRQRSIVAAALYEGTITDTAGKVRDDDAIGAGDDRGRDPTAGPKTLTSEPDPPPPSATERFRETLRGSIRVFAAEALAVPTGIAIVGFLARRLGADGYGEFTVAAAFVAWVEWSLASALSRAAVTFVAQAPDRRAAGAAVVRTYLVASLGAAVLVWVAAPRVALALRQPALAADL